LFLHCKFVHKWSCRSGICLAPLQRPARHPCFQRGDRKHFSGKTGVSALLIYNAIDRPGTLRSRWEASVNSQPGSESERTVTEAVTKRIQGDLYAAEYAPLLGGSVAMRTIRAMVGNIADTDASVLLRGESGVGKDLVARALHASSRRCNGPF